jgi:two-component system, NtrC family, sensor kinase
MEGLTRAAERVAAGRRDVRAEERGAAEVVRAASAFNRMTDQLAARESELSQQVTELEKASAGLRRAQEQVVRGERLAMVGRLAAGIAHEVGNPLAAIVGLSDVMRDGGLEEEEIKEFAGRIGNEAQRIHRTVRQLLDYARAAPGSAAPPRADGAPVEPNADVRDAIEQVRKLLQPQKAMRDIALIVDVEEALPTVGVSGDRLVQVVLNLALNAADAIRGDGRSKGEIALRARLDDARVVIEVEDDGPGVPTALRERIFEPFFTTKPAGEGTGLGLPTSAAIVEQAGGSITALGRRDGAEGARMVVTLPAGRMGMTSGGYERG